MRMRPTTPQQLASLPKPTHYVPSANFPLRAGFVWNYWCASPWITNHTVELIEFYRLLGRWLVLVDQEHYEFWMIKNYERNFTTTDERNG